MSMKKLNNDSGISLTTGLIVVGGVALIGGGIALAAGTAINTVDTISEIIETYKAEDAKNEAEYQKARQRIIDRSAEIKADMEKHHEKELKRISALFQAEDAVIVDEG